MNVEAVRNVLRALGALPCRDPQEAARSLYQCVQDMTMPDCPPEWASKAA